MAAITASNVTLIRAWEVPTKAGSRAEISKDLKIVLSAQGATIGDIPASALGFSKLYSVFSQGLDISSNGVITATPVSLSITGSEIIPCTLTQATDANRGLREDITGDLYVRVTGQA